MNVLFAVLATALALVVGWWLIGKLLIVIALGAGVFFLFHKQSLILAGVAFGIVGFSLFGFWAGFITMCAFAVVQYMNRS